MSKFLPRLFQVLILTFISCLILSAPVDKYPHSCADYNFGAVHAAKAGLQNVYMCPQKSGVVCNESFPIKDFSSISQSHLKWKDVIFSVLVGTGSSTDAFFWWISFINEEMDLVLLGDACTDKNQTFCNDHVHNMQRKIHDNHPRIRAHVIRSNQSDAGYTRLSCKIRTVFSKVYEKFPTRKYYFKIDTDTVIFPRHFFSFLNTLDSFSNSSNPIYFGTLLDSQVNPNLLMCGKKIWLNEENVGNEQKGGLCYGAGGAGYGLNNVAMKAVAQLALTKAASVPACAYPSPNYNPDYSAEDFFIAFVMYRAFNNAVLLHCEGFRSGPEEKPYIKKYISLHHISRDWVGSHNSSLEVGI